LSDDELAAVDGGGYFRGGGSEPEL
jgi:hypothetical protein